ncbi:MAG: acyl-CoA dehydrogenase family protein [bacterium]
MLGDERRTYKESLRQFLTEEIVPVRDSRPETRFTHDLASELLSKLGRMDIGPAGDRGIGTFNDPLTYALEAEEISRVWPGLHMLVTGCLPVEFLRWCSDRTRDAFKGNIKDGSVVGCLAVTEPGSGSNTASPNTTARRDGEEYVLNGEKTWVSNAPIADMAIVVARDLEQDQRDFFIVDRRTASFETREMEKLGWKSSPTGQVFFDDCRIPIENKSTHVMERFYEDAPEQAANLLEDGLLSQGDPLNAIFSFLRTGMGAMAVGIGQAALDEALAYSTDRSTFDQPIAQHQLIQEKLFTIKSAVETSRRLVYHAADLLENGDSRARLTTSLAKASASEECLDAVDEAVQVFGANGLSRDYPLERYLRDARTMTIPDGTTEIQKLIVGHELTGKSAY